MSDSALLLMAIAVAVSSVALLVHALASLGLYRSVRRLEAKLEPLIPAAVDALTETQTTMRHALAQIQELSEKASSVLDASKAQIDAFAEARGELYDRMRIQAERVELVIDDTLSRMQEVVGILHSGVIRPVREVTGVISGIRTAVNTFIRGRRPSVDRATHDEEMFI